MWNPSTNRLSTVNIFDREVNLFELHEEKLKLVESFKCSGDVGAALPTADGGFVLCQNQGIYFRDTAGKVSRVCQLPIQGENYRCNDAKLGPDGSLWVGIMDYDAIEGKGSLWRINRKGDSQLLLENLTIPNGLDWWESEFWFVDGPTEQITCYLFDKNGLTKSGKSFVTNGTPDGLAFDSTGELWLALWGEGRVDHFDAKGTVLDSIDVAAPHSTSLCFAGQQLDNLVVTSARFAMSDQALAANPSAGDLFTLKLPVSGRKANLSWV